MDIIGAIKMNRPIDYAKAACDTIMRQYSAAELPTMDTFFYIGGVFLSGMQRVYWETGEKKYFKYIKEWVDKYIFPDGSILGYNHDYNVKEKTWFMKAVPKTFDHKQPGILLFDLYKETKDERYMKAIEYIYEQLAEWKKNSKGGFWHMSFTPNQMWLDSLYMIGPFLAMYSDLTKDKDALEEAIKQCILMYENMRDKNGLLRHGWDESKKAVWARENGLSETVWGRAVGWFTVAILDILDYVESTHPQYKKLCDIEEKVLKKVLEYRNDNGVWCQVLDRPQEPDNWYETSCSCLFVYSLFKAIRKKIISENYIGDAKRAYSSIISKLKFDNGELLIDNICAGTCIDEGDYKHYINRPKVTNDLHGTGAFVLMCTEAERMV